MCSCFVQRGRINTFTKLLNIKLKQKNIKCYLKCNYNWFKNINGKKKLSPYWHGQYLCSNVKCPIVYNAVIEEAINTSFNLKLTWNGTADHESEFIISKERCTGEKRKNLALKLMTHGISNTRSDNIINKGFYYKTNLFEFFYLFFI